jgi:excisionase family DNA binding protein
MSPRNAKPKRRTREAPRAPAARRRQEFLTPTEVADRLLIAPVTVRLWAKKGLLPSVTTPGGHRRFFAEDVESFAAKRQQAQAIAEAAPSRILIIDDDAQFARYLSGVLGKHAPGVLVEVAHDGFTAGLKCEAMRPDVVTLDLQMPDMDGFEVCVLLRSMFGKSRPRILALTAFDSDDSVKRIMAAGADACISKSTSAADLVRQIWAPRGK